MCPECSNELFDGTPIMSADNVDALFLHRSCAALLAYRGYYASCDANPPNGARAKRLPGIGIEIIGTKELEHGWDDGAPWYAPTGTIYRYA